MIIKFKQETTLQVIEGYDEETDNITEEIEETFKAGEKADADIVDNGDGDDSAYVDLQFGDGSMAYGVQRSCFEIVESVKKKGK